MRYVAVACATFALSLVIAVCVDRAAAAELSGWRYDHTCLTHNDDRIGEALRVWGEQTVIEDCGKAEDPDIVVKEYPLFEWHQTFGFALGAAGPTKFWADGIVRECTVHLPIGPREVRLGVLVHEVGHCLGLGHSLLAGAAMHAYCCNPVSADDVDGVVALYGTKPVGRHSASHKLFLSAITRD